MEDAATRGKPHELDTVELLEPTGGWPAGTAGTIVDIPADGCLIVEVNEQRRDDRGLLDCLVDVPVSAVRVTARPV